MITDLASEPDTLTSQWQRLLDVLATATGAPQALLIRHEEGSEPRLSAAGDRPAALTGRRLTTDVSSFCAELIRRSQGRDGDSLRTATLDRIKPADVTGSGSGRCLSVRNADGSHFGAICMQTARFGSLSEAGTQVMMLVRDLIESNLHDRQHARASKASELAAREAEQLAARASRNKSELLTRVSHDLRTPLNAVLGFSELMAVDRMEPLGPAQQARLAQVRSASQHLLALTGDLTDRAGLDLGHLRLSLSLQPCDLAEIAADIVAQWQVLAQRSGVNMQCPPCEPLRVRADPVRIRQVLHNVVGNAVKYNRPGGLVALDLRADPDVAVLLVRDTGVGMTADQLGRLFEPFQRLGREHGPIEGSGLGLAISKEIIGLHGGQIRVSSSRQQGTLVEIHLPRVPLSTNAGSASVSAGSA